MLDALAASAWLALSPRERLPVDVWADRHRMVVGSAEPGRWRTDRVPYTRGPMRAWDDDSVDAVVCRWASQLGKTEMLFNCLAAGAAQDPAWWMFVYPTEEDCRRQNRKRLIPSIQATPELTALLAGQRDDMTGTELRLGRTEVFWSWAHTETKLKGLPVQRLALDEIDAYPPGAVELAMERCKAADRAKAFKTSTPSDKGVGIDAAYEASDRRRFDVPCPHCQTYFEMTFGTLAWGVTDPDGTERTGSRCTPDEVEQTAHVRCPACAGKIHDHHKPAMLRRGVWVREGERVETVADPESPEADASEVELTGTHLGCPIPAGVRVVGEPVNPSRVAGFRLSSLYSPFEAARFGKVARPFADAGFRMTPEYVRGWLGEAWEERGAKVDDDVLLERCRPAREGGYAPRTVPLWVMALTAGVDVQLDRLHVVVRGWGERGLRSALVDRFELPSRTGSRLVELLPSLLARYARADGKVMAVRYWGVDSGDRTDEVYEFCAEHPTAPGKCVPCKGVAGTAINKPYDWTFTKTLKGRPLPADLLRVNVDIAKTAIMGAMREPARFWLPEDDGSWDARAYTDQVTSEWRVPRETQVRIGRGGHYTKGAVQHVWVKRPGRVHNHDLDAEVYAWAVAEASAVRAMVAPAGTPQADHAWQGDAAPPPPPQKPAAPTPRPAPLRPTTSRSASRFTSRFRLPGRTRRLR